MSIVSIEYPMSQLGHVDFVEDLDMRGISPACHENKSGVLRARRVTAVDHKCTIWKATI